MNLHNGLGLAANQIGSNLSVFIIKDNKKNIIEFINPKIIKSYGEIILNEGCLSAPGIVLQVKRSEFVEVEYQDLLGESKSIIAEGMEARCLLHEYDHLQGKFYFELVNRATRKAAISKLKKNLK